MQFTTSILPAVVYLVILLVSSLSAQNMLLDDHNDQTDTNEFGSKWYYYDDATGTGMDDRPHAAPASTPSVINVAFTTKERHAFGDPDDLWPINEYTFTFNTDEDPFATMPFTFGEAWNASYGVAKPYVGISTLLAPEGELIDLSEATGISFNIKSRSSSLSVVFKVQTYDIDKDSSFAYYHDTIITSNTWVTKTILFSELKQPPWTPKAAKRPFDITKVTKLTWEILKEDNDTVISDTLDLDDIFINDYTYTPKPLPMLIDDFEDGNPGNEIGTYWYFVNDCADSGNSRINNAGPENEFLGSYDSGNASSYAGVMDFTLGNAYFYPYVMMSFDFDNSNKAPADLSGATAIQFDIKGNKSMLVAFRVCQSSITDHNHYSSMVEVWPIWRTVTVYLFEGEHGLNQDSSWGVHKPFDIKDITSLEWVYNKADNTSSSGILSIDNLKILGNPASLQGPFPPILKSPDWKSIDNLLSPEISWYKANDAVSYVLQVAISPDFTNPLINLSSHSDTTYTANGLSYGTTYYCRLKSTSLNATSGWSATNIFTTLFDTPPQPFLVTPAQNATAVPVSTTLSWNTAVGAKVYRLQISTTESFSTTITDHDSLTDTTFSLSSLANATNYYWRVNATNSSGTSQWSNIHKFTTVEIPPETPVLLSPANGVTRIALNQALSWSTAERASSYTLHISTSSSFSPLVINDSTITGTTFNISDIAGLANGKQYYWRLRAKNNGGSSSWSTPWNFTTINKAPSIPLLLIPANGATGTSVSTMLKWSKTVNAATYDLQVSPSDAFATTIIDTAGLTDTLLAVSSLNRETVYYWRVRGKNADSIGNWSTIHSFTTVTNVPGVPLPISPPNHATDIPVITTLIWSKVSEAVSYTVQLSTSASFEDFLVNQIVNTDTIVVTSSLPNDAVCYWRVQANNAGGPGGWSVVDTFTTIIAEPGTPVLISPQDNITNFSTNPAFTWNSVGNATAYRILVASDSMFKVLVKDSGVLIDTAVTVAGLNNDTKYYWKVCAINAGGSSQWSAKRSFNTIVSLPSRVILVAGASDTLKTNQVTLYWHKSVPKVSKYLIEISTNENMNGAISDTVSDTSIQLTEITDNSRYWWRVSALNDAGWGEFSERGTFFISLPISIRVPEKFGVTAMGAGNMRNGIRYALPVNCQVKICLYDFKGSLVQKMLDTYKRAGVYSIKLPELSSGAYYMQFTAGNYRYNSKLILTK